jgi:hypothetical protein
MLLAQLVGAELIYRRGTPPNAEYSFKHALVQDAAYSTLLRDRRRQLHARIAGTLEADFPEVVAAQPALLAHHCTEAGLTEKAIGYWLGAGRQAWARSATAEAIALLHRGLALALALPDSDWRRETELDLRIALGQALTASRGWSAPELGEVYSRARELALTVNRPRALLVALWAQFSDYLNRADLHRAHRLASELLDLGHSAGDDSIQVMGCDAGACSCFHLGEFATTGTYVGKGLSLFMRLRDLPTRDCWPTISWSCSRYMGLGSLRASDTSIKHCYSVTRRGTKRGGSPIPPQGLCHWWPFGSWHRSLGWSLNRCCRAPTKCWHSPTSMDWDFIAWWR